MYLVGACRRPPAAGRRLRAASPVAAVSNNFKKYALLPTVDDTD